MSGDTADNFLSENNVCGQTILRLVSRGSAIIAELLRLSRHVPDVFRIEDPKHPYAPLLFDFRYLNQFELIEHKIESSPELVDLDEQFRSTHLILLERFFKLFESVYRYIADYRRFLADLEEGVFIQQTFSSVLVNTQGKQLLSEALYLYGVMLLLMDSRIEGIVRERLLMGYFRYVGTSDIEHLDDICRLCRVTDRRAKTYPEELFSRSTISYPLVGMILGRLRSDDIYQQMSYYPNPDHRSAALSTQASMLYVLLYFTPQILHRETTIMREIVDKFFPDNWIVTYYMGFRVDLSDQWASFKAAHEALKNTLAFDNVKNLYSRYMQSQMMQSQQMVSHYLREGSLTEKEVLDQTNRLLDVLRDANVTIRWLMLHATAASTLLLEAKKKKETAPLQSILQSDHREHVLLLLLDTAQFEYQLRELFQKLLASKRSKWDDSKSTVRQRLAELSAYFSGEAMLTERVKDEQLQKYFADMAAKVDELNYEDSTLAGRKIQNMVTALENIEQFHQIESSLQVKQFLSLSRGLLHKMVRTLNIREEFLVALAQVSDISYSWEVVNDYVASMQTRIQRDPGLVIKLRSTFQKLASIMELPLVRITQASSPDAVSVSEYYSSELVAFVTKVLSIIPQSMFAILQSIIDLQTNTLKQIPTRLNRQELRDYAQLEERYQLSRATFEISNYTIGILAMEKTLVGVIQVDPKQLLEDGIRREVRRRIASAMDELLVFSGVPSSAGSGGSSVIKPEIFDAKLRSLTQYLQGMQKSLEYIQDYANIYGLRIWQEEMARIVRLNVEVEINPFARNTNSSRDGLRTGYMGRLLRELLAQTSPARTVYVDAAAAWISPQMGSVEVAGTSSFSLMRGALGICGMVGLDRLLCVELVKDLQQFLKRARIQLASASGTAAASSQQMLNMLWTLVDLLCTIGQKQLLRKHIAHELHFACKVHSNILSSSLDVLNRSIISDIQAHYRRPDVYPYPSDHSSLLAQLSEYLETAGISDPLTRIYVTTGDPPIENIAEMVMDLLLVATTRLQYDGQLDTMMRVSSKKKDEGLLDGSPFAVGVVTLLKQFHSEFKIRFMRLIARRVRDLIVWNPTAAAAAATEVPPEACSLLFFLERLCRVAHVDRHVLEGMLPPFIMDQFLGGIMSSAAVK